MALAHPEQIALLRRTLQELRPAHFHVDEDPWYSCPKHPEAGHRDDPRWDDKCQCTAEATNARIDTVLRQTEDTYDGIA